MRTFCFNLFSWARNSVISFIKILMHSIWSKHRLNSNILTHTRTMYLRKRGVKIGKVSVFPRCVYFYPREAGRQILQFSANKWSKWNFLSFSKCLHPPKVKIKRKLWNLQKTVERVSQNKLDWLKILFIHFNRYYYFFQISCIYWNYWANKKRNDIALRNFQKWQFLRLCT